jgi:hypothetical protein
LKKSSQILFSILLLLSISWQCSAKTIIYFNFKINQKQLALTLCENKDKPKSCCEAKCVLDKEIKKEEKRESEIPNALKDKAEKSELISSLFTFSCFTNTLIQVVQSFYLEPIHFKIPQLIFHPPKAA